MIYGVIFYWTCWVLWIIVTFLIKKGKQRTIFACSVLILISFSNTYVTLNSYNISLTFILLLGWGIFMHGRLSKPIYHMFVSFTIMIGYTAILLWEQNTPVWIFMSRTVLVPGLSSFIILLLTRKLSNQIITGVLGITSGELIYNLLLSSYHFDQTIGDMAFLDTMLITILFVFIFNILEQSKLKLSSISKKHHRKSFKIAK